MGFDEILYSWKNIRENPVWISFKNIRSIFKKDELGIEIAQIALPAALSLAADPIASLIDTAFIGHIGPVELAAVGVAIAIFNQSSKVAIVPLVSVTTSFVAEEDAAKRLNAEIEVVEIEDRLFQDGEKQELLPKADLTSKTSLLSDRDTKLEGSNQPSRYNSSASLALIIGGMLGFIQAVLLIFASKPLLRYMGIKSDSPMLPPAEKYLTVRSLGSPAVLLSLAMQGVFRGFKDTKTPLYASVIGDALNIILDPIFIFVFRLGVTGAAIAHVTSQYVISIILLWKLMQQVDLLPPSLKQLQFGRFLKNGCLLLFKVIASTSCMTLAASLAARLGTTPMAAFQICLQVWLATSLLADGLAVSGQAILASAFARNDFERATATASRTLQLGVVLGLFLSLTVTVILKFCGGLFTNNTNVLRVLSLGIPFVAATQPINALAFVFDGINYGANDFAYSAYSLVSVACVTYLCLALLSWLYGFVGLWIALSIFMSMRAFAGFWRIGTRTGPWNYLRG